MNLSNNKILITGGASGIGLGLTQRFIQENNTVIICGRRESVLNEVKTKFPTVITKVCDLAIEAERNALYEWITENHSDLNVLVNNAGIQNWVSVTDENFFESAKTELATNTEAPLHLTSLFIQLKSLTTVMNVTSGLALSPFAKIPVYSATKAFFRSFTISLRHILKAKNIKVIEIIPPALNTDLGGIGLHDAHPSVDDFIVSIFEQIKEGKEELTFGTTTTRINSSVQELKASFTALHSNL
ncbi:SDR family oxidoreductase [Flavobacterium hibernum]|uniref:Cytochrome C553 n=1 Tax=Flavobacterium hibernum TaxID=37752 RepID=A0A0D0ENM6_9FLAO|nr:SDR family NAD(P)-dependent oxidoreductase [Flavobacterium hibernum]KIO54740.1 cytochrome C553 [Flavobacterium hibernum]OXA85578.1 SDR family oxidoreductase [Flavobacterium hibernum]STO18499.1 Serine 3-dehydrogenase [Flavobacterium hibernum]